MRKTTVYLPDELKGALATLAATSGRSEAELIREAIGDLTRAARPRRPVVGVIDLEVDAIAARDEELLARGFGRD